MGDESEGDEEGRSKQTGGKMKKKRRGRREEETSWTRARRGMWGHDGSATLACSGTVWWYGTVPYGLVRFKTV